MELRLFHDVDDLNAKLGQGWKKAGLGDLSPQMFEDCITIFRDTLTTVISSRPHAYCGQQVY
jgi:hypothetical protein